MDGKKNNRKEMRILTYWFEKDAKYYHLMSDNSRGFTNLDNFWKKLL